MRGESGRATQSNPAFLNPELALQEFVQPALKGLGPKLGALVFQISPLPFALLADMPALLQRLAIMLHALPSLEALRQAAPDALPTGLASSRLQTKAWPRFAAF